METYILRVTTRSYNLTRRLESITRPWSSRRARISCPINCMEYILMDYVFKWCLHCGTIVFYLYRWCIDVFEGHTEKNKKESKEFQFSIGGRGVVVCWADRKGLFCFQGNHRQCTCAVHTYRYEYRYVSMYTCYSFIYSCVHTRLYSNICICIYIYIYVCLYADFIYVLLYLYFMYICVCVFVYWFICIIAFHMYIYIYM